MITTILIMCTLAFSSHCLHAQDPGDQITDAEEVPSDADLVTECNELILLSGKIQVAEGDACTESMSLSGVNLTISDEATGNSWNTTSDERGSYTAQVCKSDDLQLCITEICEEACGINSLDILLLQRLALGLDPSSASTCYGADLNADGEITTLDRNILRSYISGIPLGSDQLPSWCRWIPRSQYDSPFACEGTRDEESCIAVDLENTSRDFVRIQVGDLDHSCMTCSYDLGSSETSDRSMELSSYDGLVQLGADVRLADDADLLGLAIHYDITDDHSAVITSQINGLEVTRSEDQLYITWMSENGESLRDVLPADNTLFTMNGKNKHLPLADVVDNAVLTKEGDIRSIHSIRSSNEADVYSIKQRGSQLVISAEIPAELSIYSMHGDLLFSSVVSSSTIELTDHLLPGQLYIARLGSGHQATTCKLSPF